MRRKMPPPIAPRLHRRLLLPLRQPLRLLARKCEDSNVIYAATKLKRRAIFRQTLYARSAASTARISKKYSWWQRVGLVVANCQLAEKAIYKFMVCKSLFLLAIYVKTEVIQG